MRMTISQPKTKRIEKRSASELEDPEVNASVRLLEDLMTVPGVGYANLLQSHDMFRY